MANDLREKAQSLYQDFFMRDLTYVFAGILIWASAAHSADLDPVAEIERLCNCWEGFLVLFGTLYFVGLLAKEGIYQVSLLIFPKNTIRAIEADQAIAKHNPAVLPDLHRTTFFEHVGISVSVGAAVGLFLTAVVRSINGYEIVPGVVITLCLALGFSTLIYCSKKKQLAKIRKKFIHPVFTA